MRRAIVVLSVALSLSWLPANAVPTLGECGDFGNTSQALAATIEAPAACVGALRQIGESRFYKFLVRTAEQPIHLNVARGRGIADAAVSLRNPNGTVKQCVDARCTETVGTPAGWWTIEIRWGTGTPDSYGLTLITGTTGGLQACDSTTADDAPATQPGKPVVPPVACTGSLHGGDSADWYRFGVTEGAAIVASLLRLSGPQLKLSLKMGGDSYSCTQEVASACVVRGAKAGDWDVSVTRRDGGQLGDASYVLVVLVTPPLVQPGGVSCEPGSDSGDSRATARPLPWTSPTQTVTACSGSVTGASDTTDVFRFRVPTDTASVRATLEPGSPDIGFQLTITPPPGSCLAAQQVNGECPGESVDGQAPYLAEKTISGKAKSGEWLITVKRLEDTNDGSYHLGVFVTE